MTPRLVATDLDGVLAPFAQEPMDARPWPGSIDTLRALADLPGVHVAVVSGFGHGASASRGPPPPPVRPRDGRRPARTSGGSRTPAA